MGEKDDGGDNKKIKGEKKMEREKKGGEEKVEGKKKPKPADGGGGNKKDDIILKLDLHCEGCAQKVKLSIKNYDGVEEVNADSAGGILTVKGNVDPNWLRGKVEHKTKKKVELVSNSQPNNVDVSRPCDGGANKKPDKNSGGGGGDDKVKAKKTGEKEKKVDEVKQLNKAEEKVNEEKKGDVNKKDNDKKPNEAQGTTIVLKIPLHCDGCAHKIKRIIKKIDGVKNVSIDNDKDLVTLEGSMDMKELTPYLKEKLKRSVDILSPKKDNDGGGKAKNGKEATNDGGGKAKNGKEATNDGGGKAKNGKEATNDGGGKANNGKEATNDGGGKAKNGKEATNDGGGKANNGKEATNDGGGKAKNGKEATNNGGDKVKNGKEGTSDKKEKSTGIGGDKKEKVGDENKEMKEKANKGSEEKKEKPTNSGGGKKEKEGGGEGGGKKKEKEGSGGDIDKQVKESQDTSTCGDKGKGKIEEPNVVEVSKMEHQGYGGIQYTYNYETPLYNQSYVNQDYGLHTMPRPVYHASTSYVMEYNDPYNHYHHLHQPQPQMLPPPPPIYLLHPQDHVFDENPNDCSVM